MSSICLALPVQGGQQATARDFLTQLDDGRASAYRASQGQLGITKEVWFLAPTGGDGTLIAYLETQDFAAAVGRFAASRDDFDVWFKAQLAAVTGLDLNDPPELVLPEVLSSFVA